MAEIMRVMDAARKIMRQSGNMHQWSEGYPSEAVITTDMEKRGGFVVEDAGHVVGYFAFLLSPEPTYAKIYDGEWLDDVQSYHVVHRMASYPDAHGVFADIMDFCFSRDANIRIDTHRDNTIMQHNIEKHGFKYCGIIYLANGDERLAYQKLNDEPKTRMNSKDIYLAGGCFWGTEHYFKQIEGVTETAVGFANGHTVNPTYKEVYTDTTGHAETVHVKYDPEVVSLGFLLQMFFKAIDPTSLNKQGHDEGTRYRTGIYYTDPEDLPVIERVFAEEQQKYQQPLAVEKLPLENFYTAEEYHQDYLDKNPTGYCHLPLSLFEFARKAKERK